MKNIKYVLAGIFFGIVLTKGEAISWYRMQEMFHFQGFHMYGIFMTAIPIGALSIVLIKKMNIKTSDGEPISIPDKIFHKGLISGSLIFGFGWALTGACPGPLYASIRFRHFSNNSYPCCRHFWNMDICFAKREVASLAKMPSFIFLIQLI